MSFYFLLAFTMTATWDPSGSLCVEYKWTMSLGKGIRNTLVQSDFIGIPKVTAKAVRFGIGSDNDGSLRYLYCYVNSITLSQLGFKSAAVKFSTCSERSSANFKIMNPVGSDSICMLFQSDVSVSNSARLIFRVYLMPSLKEYALYRFDAWLGQDLWTAATNAQLTEVVFQVGDSTFPAHKFVLAARSPVFRAMFEADMKEARTGRVNIVDAAPDIFEQFLQFLYTGKLIKPASKQLGYVAEKYEVRTLSSLCQSVADDDLAIANSLLSFAKLKQTEFRSEMIITSTRY